ncbi:SAM-dependent methyltransferase [Polymorphospora lycopeni]|uniref:SAM-dependent methyltransferase n=1 Tax=Polymorphospora lycopeni TaxID=3140240 RepID=A0ABV5CQ64_9ACTN
MPEELTAVLAEVRTLLLAPHLTRAVAAGRRRGQTPSVVRAELRPVAIKAGPRLQIVTSDGVRPYTRNVAAGAEAEAAVDALLTEPFGNWHVETSDGTVQVRVTKKGDAQVHRAGPVLARPMAAPAGPAANTPAATTPAPAAPAATGPAPEAGTAPVWPAPGGPARPVATTPTDVLAHDRRKEHLLAPGDPLFTTTGASAAKRRQVDAFLRALAATLPEGDLPQPLRVVDLGCGNAYLTFAAYRYLTTRGIDARVVGVDVREDQRERNSTLAAMLGCEESVEFVAGTILDAAVDPAPDLVLALHACDTATDEALARAVRWRARWVLAAPCCHHDVAAQLRQVPPPEPYDLLTRHGILRERFADVLTDSLRAALLRLNGYRVEVVEFVESRHTPRNLLLRARRTGASATPELRAEYDALVGPWQLTPKLAALLAET